MAAYLWVDDSLASLGLSYGIVCVILGLAILVERQLVTDGQTDGQTHNDGK